MGESNVFTFHRTRLLGLGIELELAYCEGKRILRIDIYIPFIALSIYLKKSKDNKWTNFGI